MTDRMLQFFAYDHLREELKAVSKPFGDLAHNLVDTLPSNPERTVALRKLLEAKDCAVRAFLDKPAIVSSPLPAESGDRHHEAKAAAMTGSAPHDGLMAEPNSRS